MSDVLRLADSLVRHQRHQAAVGEPLQTPFAKPPGQGLSTSTVNFLWGFFNLVIGYLLVCRIGDFGLRSTSDVVALALGGLLLGLFLARHFGRFHGGNQSRRT